MRTARKHRKEPERDLESENADLKAQLAEAQETLRAIRAGEVDAVIASTPEGDRVFTLRGAETPYRVIVENISEGAATLLSDGVILYANEAFSTILKTPLQQIIGTRFEAYVREADRILLPELFEKGLKEIVRREIALANDSAVTPVFISLRRLPILGEKPGLSMVVTDISERRRAEEELRKAHRELDVRVHQRTKELREANEALQAEIAERKRVVEDLERSNRELQQFAYVASHDLQEPLRTVASYVDLLAMKYKGKLDGKADRYIVHAVEGANRMSALINDLLAYSRVGTQGKGFERLDMSQILARVRATLRTTITESGAQMTNDALPMIMGDETQLVQLLQNLVTNALKFRKKEVPPRIHISCRKSAGTWIFGVQDNGIGIEPEFYDRIFAIFQRLHTREEYPGTGVGLAICRRIVERHGGRLWVESKPGEGATFYFTLPAN